MGQGLLTVFVITVFTDDKLVLNELNQIFGPVTKLDLPSLSLKRPRGYEEEGHHAFLVVVGSPQRQQASLPVPRSLCTTRPVRWASVAVDCERERGGNVEK